MSKLRLAEADRQRLNCPEFLPIDLSTVTNREAIQLKQLGFPTMRLLANALTAEETQFEAWTAFVWLALKRAGVDVKPDELEFSLPVEVLKDDEDADPVVAEGKETEAPEASTN